MGKIFAMHQWNKIFLGCKHGFWILLRRPFERCSESSESFVDNPKLLDSEYAWLLCAVFCNGRESHAKNLCSVCDSTLEGLADIVLRAPTFCSHRIFLDVNQLERKWQEKMRHVQDIRELFEKKMRRADRMCSDLTSCMEEIAFHEQVRFLLRLLALQWLLIRQTGHLPIAEKFIQLSGHNTLLLARTLVLKNQGVLLKYFSLKPWIVKSEISCEFL